VVFKLYQTYNKLKNNSLKCWYNSNIQYSDDPQDLGETRDLTSNIKDYCQYHTTIILPDIHLCEEIVSFTKLKY